MPKPPLLSFSLSRTRRPRGEVLLLLLPLSVPREEVMACVPLLLLSLSGDGDGVRGAEVRW
jgi:hypothetical protein